MLILPLFCFFRSKPISNDTSLLDNAGTSINAVAACFSSIRTFIPNPVTSVLLRFRRTIPSFNCSPPTVNGFFKYIESNTTLDSDENCIGIRLIFFTPRSSITFSPKVDF